MNKPKVYFVGSAYMGCYYVRCWLPLLANKWSGSQIAYSKQIKPVNIIQQEMMDSDVIVFHRADTPWHHRIGMMMKSIGKKIVFDNDDTFNLDNFHPFSNVDEKGFEENKMHKNNIINNFILNSDMVTTTTEYLADEYRMINKNVFILPNLVNPNDCKEPLRNETNKIRIGLVGSVAYHHDFHIIKNIIERLDKRDDIQVVMFGLNSNDTRKQNPKAEIVLNKEYSFWDSLKNIEHFPWCEMEKYHDTLNELRLDMMLIPRRENAFNKSKSNVKFLEASMFEIPVIASSFTDKKSPYDSDIVSYENGILVNEDEKEWEDAIDYLINNKEKRLEIGKSAKEYVLKNYNIWDKHEMWVAAYKKGLNL